MNLADLSIKRPVFITSVVVLMLVAGLMMMSKLPVDLFPNVTFPVVVVSVPYHGAAPSEIETLIAKPIEDEVSTIAGIKRLSAIAQEGVGQVVIEFNLNVDIKFAENEVRDAVTRAKRNLPEDIDEPLIKRVDPADQPILILSVSTPNMKPQEAYDLADQVVKPKLEQVNQVGQVEIYGGRKREIHVNLDRTKLREYDISAAQVAQKIQISGQNIPLGKTIDPKKELVYRSMGQFQKIDEIKNVVVNFIGNDVPVTVKDVGAVDDDLVDETSRSFTSGQKALFLYAYKQSGANTVEVVDALKKKIDKINPEIAKNYNGAKITILRDGAQWIRANVEDVTETILIGILLAVIVVYLFLASGRSTFITSLALPNSLIGGFILMSIAGFSINIMSLLALSLAVGLLIDDAIVVRENIFRHLEMGKKPIQAALEGTGEVRLAVIATTFTVIAVFGPVGFLQGVVGQFFKEFGLTVCFAMLISLFDAMTVAPMLSAYLASKAEHDRKGGFVRTYILNPFDRLHVYLENQYEKIIKIVIRHPLKTLGAGVGIFIFSIYVSGFVTKTFLPPQDAGEFTVGLNMQPGTSIEQMTEVALAVDKIVRQNPEVQVTALTVGNQDGEASKAESYVKLVPYKQRSLNTSEVKQKIRDQLKDYAYATPTVKDYDAIGAGQRPFNVNIVGTDQKQLEQAGLKLLEKLKKYPGLKDVDISFRPGKPEFQVKFDKYKQEQLGISTVAAGQELRTLVDGAKTTPTKFRENDKEYDIRVRLKEDQRDLKKFFNQTYIPNVNYKLVPLSKVATPVDTEGPSKITRQDRVRYVQVNGDIAPGAGFADILRDVSRMLKEDPDTRLPEGTDFVFIGQAENFQELGQNMAIAMGLGVLFIYFVLASLYESFITPFTIMLALPLAICGSFFSLAIAHQSLNIFSWIGVIMLLGVSTKNSILLVDYTNQLIQEGKSRAEALVIAGRTRLRPILMTSIALVAGTIPLAIGLNEASKQRTSMGVAIIGGLVSSTLLTLVIVPAAFTYIDTFRLWSLNLMKRLFAPKDAHVATASNGKHNTSTEANEQSYEQGI